MKKLTDDIIGTLTPSLTVTLISAEQTRDLRDRILRGPRPVETNTYPEDALPSTFHVGVLQGDRVLSTGTFMSQPHPEFPKAQRPYRLRGMATEPEFQGKGLGKMVVTHALEQLKSRQVDLLWFNARVSAVDFYRRLGFETIDREFDIDLVGPHKVMYKWLT